VVTVSRFATVGFPVAGMADERISTERRSKPKAAPDYCRPKFGQVSARVTPAIVSKIEAFLERSSRASSASRFTPLAGSSRPFPVTLSTDRFLLLFQNDTAVSGILYVGIFCATQRLFDGLQG
jgi:hypothetical protein